MNKEAIIEKVILFLEVKEIREAITLLTSPDELDKFKAILLLNRFFKIKIKYKNGKKREYDYFTIIEYKQVRISSSSEKEHILIVRTWNHSLYTLLIKDIEDYEIDTSSSTLFSTRDELVKFCDRRFISEKGIDYVWKLYQENIFPIIREKDYYAPVMYFSERVRNILNKIDINNFPINKIIRIIDKKGEIPKHYFLRKDEYILIRINKFERPYGIVLNKNYYLYLNPFISNIKFSELKDMFKKLDYGEINVLE